jgi:hypothetical protein
MQDSTRIREVRFEHNGQKMTPVQTYMTPLGEDYIAFKLKNGAFLNIRSSNVKDYVVGAYSPQHPL